jgi:uncharacterized protein
MNQQPTYELSNPQPLSPIRSELVWEGKYDEYGDRHEVEVGDSAISLQQVYERLNTTPEQLADFCEKWQIAELALFGSVLRDDFRIDGDDPSDIDVLYTHLPNTSYGFEIFDMKEEIEVLFSRKVDFVSKNGIQHSRNWLRRKNILESAKVIYGERSAVAN